MALLGAGADGEVGEGCFKRVEDCELVFVRFECFLEGFGNAFGEGVQLEGAQLAGPQTLVLDFLFVDLLVCGKKGGRGYG